MQSPIHRAVLKLVVRRVAELFAFVWFVDFCLFWSFVVLGQSLANLFGWGVVDPEFRQNLLLRLDLSGSTWEMYWQHIKGFACLDFGRTMRGGFPVLEVLAGGLWRSLPLFAAILVAIPLSSAWVMYRNLPATGYRPGRWLDTLSAFGMLPPLVIAAVMFAFYEWSAPSAPGWLQSVIYWACAVTAAAGFPAVVAAAVTSVICRDLSRQHFVRTARAVGISDATIRRRLVRNIMATSRTQYLSIVLTGLLSTAFVELVMGIGGFGRAGLIAVRDRDVPLLSGWVLLTSIVIYACSWAAQSNTEPRTH